MPEKLTYKELELKTAQLEREFIEYVHKEKEFHQKRKSIEFRHMRRTLSLIKINEELNREISELKRANKKRLGNVSNKLKERVKELKCLYDISSLSVVPNYSLDDVLQAIVDLIPPAIQYPEIACARIRFDGYEFVTKNFKETIWKLSEAVKVNNERIGSLEVFHFKENPGLEEGKFLEEAKNLITAIAESIAQIVEREWAEMEIRKYRDKLEELFKQNE